MPASRAGELIALAGPRNPYRGRLGVIDEGAYADLLLVGGNPLKNIELVGDPATNFVLIMKDGVIYKNTIQKLRSTTGGRQQPTRRVLGL